MGSCIIGACDKAELSKMFDLKEEQKLHTVVAFGYPSHTSKWKTQKTEISNIILMRIKIM
mgnify:CR=1 FL=1